MQPAEAIPFVEAEIHLGANFIHPIYIATATHRFFEYTIPELARLNQTLPRELLTWCHDKGMILIPGPPRIAQVTELFAASPDLLAEQEKTKGWLDNNVFADADFVGRDWMMFQQVPGHLTHRLSWEEQQQAAEKSNPLVVPNAAQLVWAMMVYWYVRGEHFLPTQWVRTTSTDKDGNAVCVGHFGEDGIHIGSLPNDVADAKLGLLLMRDNFTVRPEDNVAE